MYFKLKEENILNLMYVAVCAGVLALLYAFVLAGRVNKVGVGTDRMKEIASAIAVAIEVVSIS